MVKQYCLLSLHVKLNCVIVVYMIKKLKVKHFYFTTVTVKLEACMLAVDLSVLPPAKLVPTYTAR